MFFWILTRTHPHRGTPVLGVCVGGGGGQNFFAYCGRCVYLDVGPEESPRRGC